MTLDAARVREDFPVLRREVHGRPLVYLDSAATSQKPRVVIDAIDRFYADYNSPVHRSVHELGQRATEAYEGARTSIAAFVGADPRGTVFVRNATEAINLVAYAWARKRLGPGDEILSGVIEHHSNIVSWQLAAKDSGATLRYLPATDTGEVDASDLGAFITARTKLVAITGMSNVTGAITELPPVIEAAHAVGALVLVDGAQLVPHHSVDFAALGADFLAFTGHKMCGPTGAGCLVARPELLEEMDPFLGGGEMIRDVTLEGSTWNDIPHKFEAGTPAAGEAVALGAAVDYLTALGMEAVREHEASLVRYGLKALETIDGIVIYGPREAEHRGAIFSFNITDDRGELIHPHDVGTLLDQDGVAIRAGHHCARPLMRHYDVPATCRASAYLYNTEADIDALVESVDKARRFFSGG